MTVNSTSTDGNVNMTEVTNNQAAPILSPRDKICADIADTEKCILDYRMAIDNLDALVPTGDQTAMSTAASLGGLIAQQKHLLDIYQARLDKLNQLVLPIPNNGSKQKVIPKDGLPEFNPKKWVINAQSSISFNDLDDFISQFESAFSKYSVSIDTNWYDYLIGVMQKRGDNDHLWFTRVAESQNLDHPNNKLPWSWAKKFLKDHFDYSIASDYLDCFQKITHFRISHKEPFVSMLNRYVSVAVAAQVDINNCFDIIRIFLCKLNHSSPEFCEKLLIAIYNQANQNDIGPISQYHTLAKKGDIIRKLIPSNLNDFFVLVSKHAMYLTEEWNKLAPSPSLLNSKPRTRDPLL